MDVKSIIKNALVLCAITLVAGLALGLTHEITTPLIEQVNEEKAQKTYKEVFPDADHFGTAEEMESAVDVCALIISQQDYSEATVDACMKAYDASGNVIGYVVTASCPKGYGGTVTVSVGIDKTNAKVTGVGFLTLNETAGLGMKAKEPLFKDQFSTKRATELTVIKSGEADASQVQAISGATRTSKAVTNAVNAAVYFVMVCLG